MKDRITNILLTIIVILLGIYIYIAIRDSGSIEIKVNSAVQKAVAAQTQTIPVPKDGKDASPQQIASAVEDYLATNPPKDGVNGQSATDSQVQSSVDKYFEHHPVQNGKDGRDGDNGKNGSDGEDGISKTPQIRCNTEKNRWEVRYGQEEAWQLLDGKKVSCTVSTE